MAKKCHSDYQLWWFVHSLSLYLRKKFLLTYQSITLLGRIFGSAEPSSYIFWHISLIPTSSTSFWISKWCFAIEFPLIPAVATLTQLQLIVPWPQILSSIGTTINHPKMVRNGEGLIHWLQTTSKSSKAFTQLAPIKRSTETSSAVGRSLVTLSRYFPNLIGVAISTGSTSISFLVNHFGNFIQWIWLLGGFIGAETISPWSNDDDCFWFPFNALMLIEVFTSDKPSLLIRSSFTNVLWLHVSSNANVFTSLSKSLYLTLTDTTHAELLD